ncbi:hypothetical protein HK097_009001, partial [Rhizophlyctis rosea]
MTLEESSLDMFMESSSNRETRRAEGASSYSSRSKSLALPTHWNARDKCQYVEISNQGSRVSYTGTGKSDSDAAAVRANTPIPPQCGIYYFETTIVSKGRDGYIGIGFCTRSVALGRLPGWEDSSWGYHGDDGHSFSCSGTGKMYGPTYTTGDVIGCIINFLNMTASFTRNGVHLGVAFKELNRNMRDTEKALYPSVGLRTPGEIVEANFGTQPFVFDIEQFFKEEKANLWHTINVAPLAFPSVPSASAVSRPSLNFPQPHSPTLNINELVLNYLVHNGFSETAESFARDAFSSVEKQETDDVDTVMGDTDEYSHGPTMDLNETRQRKSICEYVRAGQLDRATSAMEESYPGVLKTKRYVEFMLRCRKFIELVA